MVALWRRVAALPRASVPLAALASGVFLGALDQTVVVTALPSIIRDLDVPFTRLNEAAWIVSAYLVGYTVAMPLVGRMSDVHGRRRMYGLCLVLFAATSLACGAARSLEWLIAARGLQAVGGGALLPITFAVVGDQFPERRRSLLLGMVGGVAEAGGVLGPLYGASVMQFLDWRWIFYLNLPLSAAILAMVWAADPLRREARSSGGVDYPGAALLGGSLGALTLGLSREVGRSGYPEVEWPLVGLSVALLAAFVAWERRVASPLIDVSLFRAAPFAAGNAVSLLSGAGLIVAMVDVPLWSATVLERSAPEGGWLLMRMTVAIPLGAVLGGLLARGLGYRAVAAGGLLLSALGLSLLAVWRPDTPEAQMTRDLATAGVGFGLLLAPVTAVVVGWAGVERAGVASALVTVMRMVGMTIGLSALTAWWLSRFNSLVADLPLPLPLADEDPVALAQRLEAYRQAILEASLTVFGEIFLAAAGVCLVALVPALFLRPAMSPQPSALGRQPSATGGPPVG